MQEPDEILYSIQIRYPKLKEDIEQVLNYISELEQQNSKFQAITFDLMEQIPQEKVVEIIIQHELNLKLK